MSDAQCRHYIHQHVAELVAIVVAEKLAQTGAIMISGELLLSDQQLRTRDFASLGLGSLDWMDVATKLEDTFGIELPDELMLDSAGRTVAGWTAAVQDLALPRGDAEGT